MSRDIINKTIDPIIIFACFSTDAKYIKTVVGMANAAIDHLIREPI